MARTCQNCGQKLRARDTYCSECGVPVGTIAARPQTQEWEYCEVTWSARRFLANNKSYFWAENIVTGDEILRSEDTFQARDVTETRANPADDRRAHAAAKELADHLKDGGWEPLETTGSGRWSQRFGARLSARRGAYGNRKLRLLLHAQPRYHSVQWLMGQRFLAASLTRALHPQTDRPVTHPQRGGDVSLPPLLMLQRPGAFAPLFAPVGLLRRSHAASLAPLYFSVPTSRKVD